MRLKQNQNQGIGSGTDPVSIENKEYTKKDLQDLEDELRKAENDKLYEERKLREQVRGQEGQLKGL